MTKLITAALVAVCMAMAAGCGGETTGDSSSDTATTADGSSSGGQADGGSVNADGTGQIADGSSSDAANSGSSSGGAAKDAGSSASADAGSAQGTDGGSSSDAGSATKYTTCVQVGQCITVSCSANVPNCQDVCYKAAAPAAKAKADKMFQCMQIKCVDGACKGNKDPKCIDKCSTDHCLPEFLGCLDSGVTGKGLCGEAMGCFDKCDLAKSGGITCYGGCYDALTKESQAKIAAIGTCAAKNIGQEIDKVCGGELFACIIDGKSGNDPCHEVFGCVDTCKKGGKSEDDCGIECVGKLTPAAQKAYMGMSGCFEQDTSATKACKDKFKTCILPTGKQTCVDVMGCVQKCDGGMNSPTCPFKCLKAGNDKAFDDFFAWSTCFNACKESCKASKDAPDKNAQCVPKCQQKDCPKAIAACIKT